MNANAATAPIPSTESLSSLIPSLSFLCFGFFYLSLLTFAIAFLETVLGIIRQDEETLGWWRRARLVALTYAQMYLSQHFLHSIGAIKADSNLPEKSYWMASQTITTAILLFSVVNWGRGSGRVLIGRWHSLEKLEIAQILLTFVVGFNVFLIAGIVASLTSIVALLVHLDWRLVGLLLQVVAIWKSTEGNLPAELSWNILHCAIAIGTLITVHRVGKVEGTISLPIDSDEKDYSREEKVRVYEAPEDIHDLRQNTRPETHMGLRLASLILVTSACLSACSSLFTNLIMLKAKRSWVFNDGSLKAAIISTLDLLAVLFTITVTSLEFGTNPILCAIRKKIGRYIS